jgi:UDP-N-acetyl-D-glucosamine/UDP-N-acetyl-D-galactosamine dehydrogenase
MSPPCIGVTEDECVPVLEKFSGLKFNVDFFAGYSPERINPGDKEHTVTKILKVTSGSTPEVAEYVDQLYKSVIKAGTHKASSIKVAEAAKVIEIPKETSTLLSSTNCQKFQFIGNRYPRSFGSCWDEMELSSIQTRPCWRTLYRCRSILPCPKSSGVGYHPEIILAGEDSTILWVSTWQQKSSS